MYKRQIDKKNDKKNDMRVRKLINLYFGTLDLGKNIMLTFYMILICNMNMLTKLHDGTNFEYLQQLQGFRNIKIFI